MSPATTVLETIKKRDPAQQITVLRNTVVHMGDIIPISAKSTAKAARPLSQHSTAPEERVKTKIEGITEQNLLSYIDYMNAFDFTPAVGLFAEEGALQPPFQKPIVGREAILNYMREECIGLKMMPDKADLNPQKITAK